MRAREPLLRELSPAGERLSPLAPVAVHIPRLINRLGLSGNPTRSRNRTHTLQVRVPLTGVGTQRAKISAGGLLLAREVRVLIPAIITVQSTTAAPTDRVRTRRTVNPGIVRKHRVVRPLQPEPGRKVMVAVAPREAMPATAAGRVSAAADPSLRTVFR